jgi:flavodoxin I
MRTALIYGSTTGNTQSAAEGVRDAYGAERIETFADVGSLEPEQLKGYELLIIGIPTWNTGELQEDWITMHASLDGMDFSGTKVALFGLGDAAGYPENFIDGVGMLYERFTDCGATGGLGFTSSDGYAYTESLANLDGDVTKFCGLALDEDNESDKSDDRVDAWVAQLHGELGLE